MIRIASWLMERWVTVCITLGTLGNLGRSATFYQLGLQGPPTGPWGAYESEMEKAKGPSTLECQVASVCGFQSPSVCGSLI